jgi:hypothetical protein
MCTTWTSLFLLDKKPDTALIELKQGSTWASSSPEQGTAMSLDGRLLSIFS